MIGLLSIKACVGIGSHLRNFHQHGAIVPTGRVGYNIQRFWHIVSSRRYAVEKEEIFSIAYER